MLQVDEYRRSFTIYVIGSDQSSVGTICESLTTVGYNSVSFFHSEEALKELKKDPPHIVLYFYDQAITSVGLSGLKNIFKSLPEVCVIVLTEHAGFVEAINLYERGVFDCLVYPMVDSRLLTKSVDRAVASICSTYLNEQLDEKLNHGRRISKKELNTWNPDGYIEWYKKLFVQKSIEAGMDHFIQGMRGLDKKYKIIFFRYIEAYQSLVATHSLGFETDDLKGIGVKLLEKEPGFSERKLREPNRLIALRTLLFDALGVKDYEALPFVAERGVQSILVLVGAEAIDLENTRFSMFYIAFAQFVNECQLKQLVESQGIKDLHTQAFQKKEFHRLLRFEIARARRIRNSVSLLIISIDSLSEGAKVSERDRAILPRLVSQVIHKNCRVNDLVGRIGDSEFGILLPHTEKWGAAVKAERLRLILGAADFSKVLVESLSVQVSIGISEYPGLCHDGEELFRTADEALSEVQRSGESQVCVFSSPSHFEPDFDLR